MSGDSESPQSMEVDADLDFDGVAPGDVTVLAPAKLRLSGTVLGSLYVEAGAKAEVTGSVLGAVINRGFVLLRGVVGALRTEGGVSVIDAGDGLESP